MPISGGKRVLGALCAITALSMCALPAGAHAASSGPALATPPAGAAVDSLPSFQWKAARRAAKYEFQLAADPNFESIVLGQGNGSFQTRNTFATVNETLPNGNYYWRVRNINDQENASRWSVTRTIRKRWNDVPALLDPVRGETIQYPSPLILRWLPVPRAYKYLVWIGTDPTLATLDKPVETSGTAVSVPTSLGPGRYYWAVAPIDAQKHVGQRSGVGSFVWDWPSRTATRVVDLNEDARVIDPQFNWDPVAGAVGYEVEINPSEDFAIGSKICCTEKVIGTSLSPKKVLANNTYYWRVRALDTSGRAGEWNYGTPFQKTFDNVTPTIPSLHMRDRSTENPVDTDPTTPQLDTSSPIVRWDPVPGASVYQVQVVPHTGAFCNWTASARDQWHVQTAATAWTPLSSGWNQLSPGVELPPSGVNYDANKTGLVNGTSYCVRVLAQTDDDAKRQPVVSEWTQLNGAGNAAFKFVTPTDPGLTPGPLFNMPGDAAYREPATGIVTPRLPLFTWEPIAGAKSYFVVVAKDAEFTNVVDVGLTNLPMYAPRRKNDNAQTYPDETTYYYWAVVPATGLGGEGVGSHPSQNFARIFQKQSPPPTQLTPSEGEDISRQPVFRWTSTEGARNYNVQVATDPNFNPSSLLDNVTTAATSYTSEITYPADTVLYWRVRATDENDVGLTWSRTGTFRRRLPIPKLFADNPIAGETIPVLRWHPVEGATSYDMHVDQSDGSKKDFHLNSTAFTAGTFYGTGVWHWQVRANFPGTGYREVSGGYTPAQPFTRRIATPAYLRAVNKHRHMLLKWNPAAMAKSYRVEIATTDSFTEIVERATTDNTEWAPKLTQPQFIAGGKFYWRVAAEDEGRNVGGWRVAQLRTRRGFDVTVNGFPRKKAVTTMRVYVRDGRRRGLRRVKVVVTGAGTKRRARRTNRDGIALLSVKPRRRGILKFRLTKKGYRASHVRVHVN